MRRAAMGTTRTCTTREFSRWALEAHVNFHTLPDTPFDRFMGEASGAGVIFGNTGGVMEAALRTAYEYITGKEAPASLCHLEAVRGYDSFRKAVVPITDDLSVRVAVLYGTGEVRKFLDRENLADYDFVEVMTCPGGCIGGGGQPNGTPMSGTACAKPASTDCTGRTRPWTKKSATATRS